MSIVLIGELKGELDLTYIYLDPSYFSSHFFIINAELEVKSLGMLTTIYNSDVWELQTVMILSKSIYLI